MLGAGGHFGDSAWSSCWPYVATLTVGMLRGLSKENHKTQPFVFMKQRLRNTCFLTMEKNATKDRALFHRGFSWNIHQWGCLLLIAGEMRQNLKNGVVFLLLGLLVSEKQMIGALSYVDGWGQYFRTWDILDEGFFSYRIPQLKKTRETFLCRLSVFFSFWR